MYKKFYGLRDIPFSLAPDPKYLFRTNSLLEVFANLQYGIENGKGLVVVTGEVGTGKTTILRSMLQSLDRSVLAAYIFNPILSTDEFFDLLLSEFRLRPQPSKSAALRVIGYLLMSRHAQGLRTVIVVDEAHLLQPHLLEEIRLLLNFETNREKLVQIILCGQPELHDLMAQPELRHLKQRVSLKCSVQPLTARETAEYVRWRLRVAGAKDDSLFEPEALRLVHAYSGGIPRLINNIGDNALLSGFSEASPRIHAGIVRDVVETLDLSPLEIASPSTVGEAAAEREAADQLDANREPQAPGWHAERRAAAPSNVHYIRQEPKASPQAQAANDRVRFVIPGEKRDASSNFFSRVCINRGDK